jgi:hypothetical protein
MVVLNQIVSTSYLLLHVNSLFFQVNLVFLPEQENLSLVDMFV